MDEEEDPGMLEVSGIELSMDDQVNTEAEKKKKSLGLSQQMKAVLQNTDPK